MEEIELDTYQDISTLLQQKKMPSDATKDILPNITVETDKDLSKHVGERNVEDDFEIFQYDSHDQLADALEKKEITKKTDSSIIEKPSKKSSWVQCDKDNCHKWRRIDHVRDVSSLEKSSEWVCSMNTDPLHNDCALSQESIPGENGTPTIDDNLLMSVYSDYQCGDIVFGKLAGYPWWPALIEEDPDYDCHYYVEEKNKKTVIMYHVTFFGKSVSRAWLNEIFVTSCDGHETIDDLGQLCHRGKNHSKKVEFALDEAKKALEYTHERRLRKYGFLRRYRGKDKPVVDKKPKGKENVTTGSLVVHASSSQQDTSKTKKMGKETARKAKEKKLKDKLLSKEKKRKISSSSSVAGKINSFSTSVSNDSSILTSSSTLNISSSSDVCKKKIRPNEKNNSSLFTSEGSTSEILTKQIEQIEKEVNKSENDSSGNKPANSSQTDQSKSPSIDFDEQPACTSERKCGDKVHDNTAASENKCEKQNADEIEKVEEKVADNAKSEIMTVEKHTGEITTAEQHAEDMINKYSKKEDIESILNSKPKKKPDLVKKPAKKRKLKDGASEKKSDKQKNAEAKDLNVASKKPKKEKKIDKDHTKKSKSSKKEIGKPNSDPPKIISESISATVAESNNDNDAATLQNTGKQASVQSDKLPAEKVDSLPTTESEAKPAVTSQHVNGDGEDIDATGNKNESECVESSVNNEKSSMPKLVEKNLPAVSAVEVLKTKLNSEGSQNVPKLKKPSFKAPVKASKEKNIPTFKPPNAKKPCLVDNAKPKSSQEGKPTVQKPPPCANTTDGSSNDVDIDSMLADD